MWSNRHMYTSLLSNKKEPPRLVNQEGSYNKCLLDY